VLRRRSRHGHPDPAGLSPLRTLGSALALLLCALALGCGGSGETSTIAGPAPEGPLPKDEFIRQADAICLSGDSRIEAAADDLAASGQNPTPAQVRRIALDIVVPGLEAELDAIGALPPPSGDTREVEGILSATQEGIDQIEADPESLTAGPPPGLEKAGRLARAYGAEECGVR